MDKSQKFLRHLHQIFRKFLGKKEQVLISDLVTTRRSESMPKRPSHRAASPGL